MDKMDCENWTIFVLGSIDLSLMLSGAILIERTVGKWLFISSIVLFFILNAIWGPAGIRNR